RRLLRVDRLLRPRAMLEKPALAAPLPAAVARIAPAGPLRTSIALTLATALFMLGGLGARRAGVVGVLRDAWSSSGASVACWRGLSSLASRFRSSLSSRRTHAAVL